MTLEPGSYAAEWFGIEGRQTVPGATTAIERRLTASFSAPPEASGPVVLYLKKVGR